MEQSIEVIQALYQLGKFIFNTLGWPICIGFPAFVIFVDHLGKTQKRKELAK